MAISTPAQKPRGDASSTLSTAIGSLRLVIDAPLACRVVDTTVENTPVVVSVDPGSAAERSGIRAGDVVRSVNGVEPRDVIEWQGLVDGSDIRLVIERDGESLRIEVGRRPDEPFGVTVSSAVFDRIHTCDNHCEFCFIFQLPKGMRRSLYTKDDDFRLSFLYGNFTTLTRFTEADLERVVAERLSPLYVSIHATDPAVRSGMLRNERGGTSLRWLGQMLLHGIEVHAQVVLCPGVNDGSVLDDTLMTLLEEHPGLSTIAVVPVGLSRHNTETRMRIHSAAEAARDVAILEAWAQRYRRVLGRRVVFAADELYLRAGLEVPGAEEYGDFSMLEDGIGIVRSFTDGFTGAGDDRRHRDGGFFGSVDATSYVRSLNPAAETGLRRQASPVPVTLSPRRTDIRRMAVVTGELGARVIGPLVGALGRTDVEVIAVPNAHFGGNTAVAGLLTFGDITAALRGVPRSTLCLLPDVCLNGDRFLDGHTVGDLAEQFSVEVVPTSGTALRARIDSFRGGPQ